MIVSIGDPRPALVSRVRQDRALVAVVGTWVLCVIGYFSLLFHFASPLPWCDEWELTDVAVGKAAVTWEWLWRPQNEHRAPLTRLVVLWLGRLTHWDLRLAHYANVVFVAIGAWALASAARKVRGRAALMDVLFPLIVLTPWQFESLVLYAYAYALALALFCLALAVLVTRKPEQSRWHLIGYLAASFAITASGGPVGNVWALGLCAALIPFGIRASWRWRLTASIFALPTVVASLAMLYLMPRAPDHHHEMATNSVSTFFSAFGQLLIGWLGEPAKALWPWSGALLAAALATLATHAFRAVRRPEGISGIEAAPRPETIFRSLDLIILLGATGAVAAVIALGRGGADVIQSRYATLTIPIALVFVMLQIRLNAVGQVDRGNPTPVNGNAPALGVLALCATFSVGWNWPVVLDRVREWNAMRLEAQTEIARGQLPLAEIADTLGPGLGYAYDPGRLLNLLLMLREGEASIFRGPHRQESIPGMGIPQCWQAESTKAVSNLKLQYDPNAADYLALESTSPFPTPALAHYEVVVPADGVYELCCRVFVPCEYAHLVVQTEKVAPIKRHLPKNAAYYTYFHGPHAPIWLPLAAGRHTITLTLDQPGCRLDMLELIPRRADFEIEAMR